MTELKTLEDDAKALVRLAIKAGADACDVVVARGHSLSASVRGGALEDSGRSESNTVSLRVFCGKRVASANSNAQQGYAQLAERVVAMAGVSPEDPYQGLADEAHLANQQILPAKAEALELFDDFEPEIAKLESLALEAERAGLGVDGIAKSMGAGGAWGATGFVLATSHGFTGSYQRSGFSISASFVAGEGSAMERDYEFDSTVHFEDLAQAEEIGKLAGRRTVKRLNPKQVKSGIYPVVFDPRVSSDILSALCGAINAGSIVRKTSFLREKMDEQITPEMINIIDDPGMKRKRGSHAFDGEGVNSEKLSLVRNGRLKSWLLDSATARELSLVTNGRAVRNHSGTSPSPSNCYMERGEQTPAELIAGVKKGLYLTETIGHGINMVTGDYSKGAAGYWIENGELAFPVAEVTIAGNLVDMFMAMTPANDLSFKYGTNAPTLLIEGMTIGGL